MSQEKIDAYKKEKSGRKQAIAKHKKRVKIAKISGIIVAVAIVAAIVGGILWNNFGGSSSAPLTKGLWAASARWCELKISVYPAIPVCSW